MPSNSQYADLLDEFKASIDPMDVATLFAGLRNSVPLSMLFRSGDTNAGHDEMLAKLRGPAVAPAPPTVDQPSYESMAFNMQYRDPRIFGVHPDKPSISNQMLRAMMDEYNRQGRDPYSKETATRRKDFEEAPISAQHYMSAAPKKTKKFANGGAIDFTVPDMQDGGRFLPDAQPFNRGGSAKKTLDQMQAEIAQKLKPQPQPDLSRRKFFGLGKAEQLMPFDSAMQLNKKDPAFQEALALYMHDNRNMFKNAPAITEKIVTVDPGKGAAKSTLKSLSETPMSRREVLQSAAGQVMRGALPDLGGLGAMGNVAKVAESVAPQAYEASAIPGLMAALMRTGMSPDEAGAMVEKLIPKAPQGWPTMVGDRIKAPAENMPHVGQDTPLMSIFGEMVRPAFQNGPFSIRPEMRDLRRLSPEDYDALKETARDIKQYGHEN